MQAGCHWPVLLLQAPHRQPLAGRCAPARCAVPRCGQAAPRERACPRTPRVALPPLARARTKPPQRGLEPSPGRPARTPIPMPAKRVAPRRLRWLLAAGWGPPARAKAAYSQRAARRKIRTSRHRTTARPSAARRPAVPRRPVASGGAGRRNDACRFFSVRPSRLRPTVPGAAWPHGPAPGKRARQVVKPAWGWQRPPGGHRHGARVWAPRPCVPVA